MKYEPLVPEMYYHIYNRGNNREDIFIEDKNYSHFINLLQKHIKPVAEIHAYCLLKNHFHLLVKIRDSTNEKLISQAFSNCFNAYAKAINKAYNRSGSLFQDRFSRIHIKEENYLIKLILYIHMNPIKHKFTDNFSTYKYSSFPIILSTEKTWLEREEVISLFGDLENFKSVHLHRQLEIEEDEVFYLE